MPNWTKEQLDAIYKNGTNIIVSAGAGSGKTAVLTERVLQYLKNGENIDELLILTFTKAAAAEMKARIRTKLIENNLSEQLSRIDSAYITTFDSYALSLVKKYSHILNINKNIKITDQSILNLKKISLLDDVFEKLYAEAIPSFLKLIDDFCSKDDNEIRNYIIELNDKLDMNYFKDDYLKKYLEKYYSQEYMDSKIKEYEEILMNIIAEINSLVIEIEEYVDSEYYQKINESLGELLISSNYKNIKSNLVTFPRLPNNSLEEAKEIKDKINDLLKKLKNLCVYDSIDDIKKSIYQTKDNVDTLIKIVNLFSASFNKYKQDNDLYDFIDIAKLSIKLVSEYKEIREEIKSNFKEILIDEYQDTNDLQDIFISNIQNNNVYMVGDIKQSIYRFRNANPYLFKLKYDDYSYGNNGIKIDLNKNFRSRSEVLDSINLIFDDIMSDKIGGADYSNSHRMIFGNEKYNNEGKISFSSNIEINTYNYDKKSNVTKEEIEAFAIANDIKNKVNNQYKVFDASINQMRDLKYNDIAILIDRSTSFNLYKKIFEYLDIPLTIYKDESITENVDISIIKHIINLIIHKKVDENFKYSFISLERSYLYNNSDDDIFEYFVNDNYYNSDLMQKINEIDTNVSLKELINNIIQKFNFYEKIITVGEIDKHIISFDYIVDLASNLDTLGYTINDFYDYLEEIINKKLDIRFSKRYDDNGVKLMTIHASKGLEFPICYYSGLYMNFNIADLKERFIYNNKYGLIIPYFDNGIRNTIYKDLLKQSYIIDEISEKIRLFYVALTRAKEKIIIFSPVLESKELNENAKLSYRSFYDVLCSVKDKINPYIKIIDWANLNINRNYNFVKKTNYKDILDKKTEKIIVREFTSNKQEILNDSFSKKTNKLYTKDIYKNIEFGKNIHNILENIDLLNPNYDLLNEFEKNKVQCFIDTGILNNVKKIYKEYEFSYVNDDIKYHGIIDLLLEFDNEYKIIDYKLKNISDEAYIKQLLGYKEYIESISTKPVSIYLYSIVEEKLNEIK